MTTPMPELPKAHCEVMIYDFKAKPQDPVRYRDVYTAAQMQAYAIAAIEATSAKPAQGDAKDAAEIMKALKITTVHLIAATSLLERGGKKAAASDKIFLIMLNDYNKAIEIGRAAIASQKGEQ